MHTKLAQLALRNEIINYCKDHDIMVKTLNPNELSFPVLDITFKKNEYDLCYTYLMGYVKGLSDKQDIPKDNKKGFDFADAHKLEEQGSI